MAKRVTGSDSNAYLPLFHIYVKRSLEQLRAQIRKVGATLSQDDREQTLRTLDFALKIECVASLAGRLLVEVAASMEQAGLREQWTPYLISGLEQSRLSNNPAIESDLSYYLGMLYQLQAKYDEANRYLADSAVGFAAIGSLAHQARALNRLGHVARLQRKYDEANRYVEKALSLLGKKSPGREFSYYVKGMIALEQGKPEIAVDWLHQSIKICERSGDKRMIAQRLLALIVPLYEQHQFDQAILCGNRAIELFKEVNDPVQTALTEMNLGNVYMLIGDPKRALENYQSAEPVLQQVSDELHLAMIYVNQGIALRMLHELERAERYLLNGVERWQRLGNIRFLTDTLDELGLLYHAWRQYDKAISAFDEGLTLLQNLEQLELQSIRHSLNQHRSAVITEAQTLNHRVNSESQS